MRDRLLVGVDDLDGQDQREELLAEVLVGRRHRAVEQRGGALLGAQLDARVAQRGARERAGTARRRRRARAASRPRCRCRGAGSWR